MSEQTNKQAFEAQKEQMERIVECIDSWNGDSTST